MKVYLVYWNTTYFNGGTLDSIWSSESKANERKRIMEQHLERAPQNMRDVWVVGITLDYPNKEFSDAVKINFT